MWKLAGTYSAVGIEISAAVLIGAIGGHWLDGKFDTAPYLMWFGLIVGLGAAVKAIARTIKSYKRDNPPQNDS